MRALVAGGAGFIGSHLCDALLGKGWEVLCLDNLITGSEQNIAQASKNKSFDFIKKDISEPFSVSGHIDHVINLASPASPVDYMDNPIETMKAGSFGTYNTLEVAKERKAVYLMASTSEIYGDPLVSPQAEEYWGNVNPTGPRSVYDESKRFSEALVCAYRRKFGINTKIIRLFNTYGPRMKAKDGRVVPNFIDQSLKGLPLTVYGDGSQTRSFCYIADIIDAILRFLDSSDPGPLNLGNPKEFTIKELADIVNKKFGRPLDNIKYKPLPQDDPKQRRPDISKAKQLLGWEPKVALEEGLCKTTECFKIRGN
jgi:dTDP-glucose 4,6-dehydratase